jgi:hypothetical protein
MSELIDKSVALYFTPESIGSPDGAHCSICWKFDPFAKTCVEVDGDINGIRGICGLYVNGDPMGHKIPVSTVPARKVSKAEAGYAENGPTHCGNCDEMITRAVYMASPCKKVKGQVDGRACCGLWEKAS